MTISRPNESSPAAAPLALVVEDNDMAAELIRAQLSTEGLAVLRARSAEEALRLAADRRPDLFTVDILLPGMDGWELLAHLKQDERLADVPVVIISIVADRGRGLSLGATGVLQKPYSRRELEQALSALDFARPDGAPPMVLVVDDDPRSVELFAAHLAHANYRVLRAGAGAEGLTLARAELPDLIVLDLMMPEMSGFEVVERLKEDPATAAIPVLIVTAKILTDEDRRALNGHVLRIMEKAEFDHGRFINEVRRALRRRTG
ncbi:MAG: response regulator [Candidatus Nitricoxidivorans perseverans]|uniref:Response regulator n=1 Tax=Candidatus Nitricoxidivorans perseverans TaxID=2975601 RepID=A0AA49IY01_9PROT|nr:MAG: response regulator [Candidatus Nitricoxidivorans perseverans]